MKQIPEIGPLNSPGTALTAWGKKFLMAVLGALLVSPVLSAAYAGETLRIATTTSTHNSGLTDYLLPHFSDKYGYEIDLKAVGTGKALQMGRNGLADLIIVHARPAEDAFMEAGFGLERRDFIYNDFVIVGPESDPARVRTATTTTTVGALRAIEQSKSKFISRADDSGTNKKELRLWDAAGIEPYGEWYFESGEGMLRVLKTADQQDAYTLIDRGTWLSHRKESGLQIVFEGDRDLHNPYGVITVNPGNGGDIDAEAARLFLDWVTSAESLELIRTFRVDGEQLFFTADN